jgi:Zn-dependent protease with chaperone function
MSKRFVFNKMSVIFLVAGIVTIALGFIIMGTGDITVSPILLIVSYVVFFPAAILSGLFSKKKENEQDEGTEHQPKGKR